MVRIDPFRLEHTDGVGAFIVPIQRDEFGISITYDDQPDLRDIAGYYQKGSGEFWVALDGPRVVGTIALLDIGSGDAALRKMFVAREYRGAPHHTALLLLETLLAHARAGTLKTIYLGTTAQFIAAHRFYEKNGFEVIEPTGLPDSFPRMAVDSRFYRLHLAM